METRRSQARRKSCEVTIGASSSRPCAVKKCHNFKQYPRYSSIREKDLRCLLHGCRLEKLYACLEWRWTPFDFIVDFVGHAQIQESARLEETIVKYFPRGSGTPIVFTMHKVAETFNLDVQGFCVDKAAAREVNMGNRFHIQKTRLGEAYFSVASAATSSLHILGRFVIQVIFQSQNMKGTMVSMRHLQVALDGYRVAWGKLLWKYLLKRLQSCQQQDGAKDFYSKLKSSYAGLAAVVGALLLRVQTDGIPAHETWYCNLLGTLPDADDSEMDHIEFAQDEPQVQPMETGEERKRRRSCGPSGSHSYGECEDGLGHQQGQGSDVDVDVMIDDDDDDDDDQSNFAELSLVDPEANANNSAIVVYHSPEEEDDSRVSEYSHEEERQTKRSKTVTGAAKEENVDVILRDARVPLIKWEDNRETVVKSSDISQGCPETREMVLINAQVEQSTQGVSERKGGKVEFTQEVSEPTEGKVESTRGVSEPTESKVEELSGQDLLEQFTKMVKEWSEKTSTDMEDASKKELNGMTGRRDVFESVSNANRILENTLRHMEETVQQKGNCIQEKYDALQHLIKERNELMVDVEDAEEKQNSRKEAREVGRDIAKQHYYEKVVTADLSFEIMDFKRETKLMNLYAHVNLIQLERREVEVKSMMKGIHILLQSLNSLEENLLQDTFYEEIRDLLSTKTFMLNKLVEDIRNLNEGLKRLQEKLQNKVELLELKEDEIKSSTVSDKKC